MRLSNQITIRSCGFAVNLAEGGEGEEALVLAPDTPQAVAVFVGFAVGSFVDQAISFRGFR